jgi:hypothetical protein
MEYIIAPPPLDLNRSCHLKCLAGQTKMHEISPKKALRLQKVWTNPWQQELDYIRFHLSWCMQHIIAPILQHLEE